MIPRGYVIVSGVLVVISLLAGVALYSQLPVRAPIHWNVHGVADGYGPTWVDAFMFPVVTALLLGLLVYLPRVSRWRENFDRFGRTYGKVMVAVTGGLVALHLVVLLKASGKAITMDRAMPAVVGAMIAITGNWMGKLRRNSLMGIRTPWTLASDYVWERTHRAGGKVMVGYGLAVLAAAVLARGVVIVAVVIVGALGLTVWAMVYSWMVSRRGRSQTLN